MSGKIVPAIAYTAIATAVIVGAWHFAGIGTPAPARPAEVLADACEQLVKLNLKSPSTYKRIKAMAHENSAFIEYDAANAFGTPIRGDARCTFAPRVGDERRKLTGFYFGGRNATPDEVRSLDVMLLATAP